MRLVILGRDGVINRIKEGGIRSPEDWSPLPGSLEAIARLNHAGYKVAVATEQPDLRDGRLDLDTLNAIHGRFHQLLGRVGGHVDALLVCPHGPDDASDCMETKPALYQDICDRFSMTPSGVPVISDGPDDLLAAQQVGAEPLLVGEKSDTPEPRFPCFDDLSQAVEHLLNRSS